jgi:uncharacterized protein YkwD
MHIATSLGALAALAVLTSSTVAPQAAPRFVSAADGNEPPVAIAFIKPHRPIASAAAAAALLADMNAERARRGIPALRRDAVLDRIAYAKALDMAARGYFGHTDPNGATFHDRMRAWNWPTAYTAENIAFDWDEPHAHSAFMNSPGHARNVVDPNESRVGVAAVTVGFHETFFVEDFSAK